LTALYNFLLQKQKPLPCRVLLSGEYGEWPSIALHRTMQVVGAPSQVTSHKAKAKAKAQGVAVEVLWHLIAHRENSW
jgi:hypothetical protein